MKTKATKQQYWQQKIAESTKYPGGVAAYCRDKAISVSSIYYWKKKLASGHSKSPVISPSFVPVSVCHTNNELPDPEWLAQFVGEFVRSMK